MKIWVVVYEHRHGCDAWPVVGDETPTIEDVKRQCDFEDGEYIEIRGPWTVGDGGEMKNPPNPLSVITS